MHFNEEIATQFQGDEDITDEKLEKAIQEMQLINLKRMMKNNHDGEVKRVAASNTIVNRNKNNLDIFSYKPMKREASVNPKVEKRLNDIRTNQTVAPVKAKQRNAIELMTQGVVKQRWPENQLQSEAIMEESKDGFLYRNI